MRSIVGLLAALVLATACSSGSTGPKYPALAGTYNTAFSITFDNAAEIQNETITLAGTLTLGSPDGAGDFTGSYVYTSGGVGSGTIAGTIQTDGGITITQFGDPNQSLGASLQYLQNTWPNCNFGQVGAAGFTGNVSGGTVALSGGLNFRCNYINNSTQQEFSEPTTLTEDVTGTRN